MGADTRTFGRLLNSALTPTSCRSSTQIQIRPRPAVTHKKLKPMFWQHGGSAIELSSAWLSLAREKLKDVSLVSPPLASFLYPKDMADKTVLSQSLRTGLASVSIRTKSCSATPSGARKITVSARNTIPAPMMPLQRALGMSSLLAPDYLRYSQMRDVDTEPGEYYDAEISQPLYVPAGPGQQPHYLQPQMSTSTKINEIIRNEDYQYSDLLWKLYQQLPPHEVPAVRLPMLLFLAQCSSAAELDRMQHLISATPNIEFTNELTTVAVRLYIRLRDISKAFQYFYYGLTKTSSPQPLEDLLIYSFWLRDWQLLSNVWQAWINVRDDTPRLLEVAKIPNFHRHLLRFLKYTGFYDRHELPEDFSLIPDVPAQEPKDPSAGYIFRYQFHQRLANSRFRDLVQQLSKNVLAGDCPLWEAEPFLSLVASSEQYEAYIMKAAESKNHVCFDRVFKLYRNAKSYSPSQDFLQAVFLVAKQIKNDQMAIMAYEDWIQFHSYLSQGFMFKLMNYFAYRGDPKAVHTIWKRHRRDPINAMKPKNSSMPLDKARPKRAVPLHPVGNTENDAINDIQEPFDLRMTYRRYRLVAFAMQGSVKRARAQLDEIVRMEGGADLMLWNSLLVGFRRSKDYRGAVKLFMELTAVAQPDNKVFANMMSTAATQGDLQYALELFGQAKELKMENTVDIVEKVVFAFCCARQFTQGKAVLEWALESGLASTRMFNHLMRGQAAENKLLGVEAMVELMEKHSFSWDNYTFVAYMHGFVNTRMPEAGWKVYNMALKSRRLIPEAEHFAVLMCGWNLSGQPWRTFEMDELMRKLDVPHSLDTIRLMVIAKRQSDEMHANKPQMTQVPCEGGEPESLVNYYRRQLELNKTNMSNPREWHVHSVVHSQMVARSLATLTTIHHWDLAEELLEMYQGDTNFIKLPNSVLSPAMWIYYNKRDYAKVKSIWNKMFSSAVDSGRASASMVQSQVAEAGSEAAAPEPVADQLPQRTSDNSAVLSGVRWVLDGPFTTMRFVLTQEGDARGLLGLANRLVANGFCLSRRNWNHVVQVLAQRGLHIDAFDICEKRLIQTWAGWATRRRRMGGGRALKPETRWLGRHKNTVFATSYTLIILLNEHQKLKEMEPWSSDAAATLEHLRENCKNVLDALNTWKYCGSEIEKDLFGENEMVRELKAHQERDLRYEREEFERLVRGEPLQPLNLRNEEDKDGPIGGVVVDTDKK
ncbi:Pentatricopeptide repeat-containing protein mitochondrial [Ceratocystis lukuohia]|uniref:Pentatricopeptide repeat-containing protein mitochondrial n=1 Tax=Ceratocystis lukuohia TaxID=2019550 RepID=A0ABR4MCS0_9PEZI